MRPELQALLELIFISLAFTIIILLAAIALLTALQSLGLA